MKKSAAKGRISSWYHLYSRRRSDRHSWS